MEYSRDQWTRPDDWTRAHKILWDFGFIGHYLHFNGGGRSGRGHVLQHLFAHGGTMTQRELQSSFDIKSGSLSEVLAKLEADGLIERVRDEDDRRQQVVTLTERGRDRAVAAVAKRDRFETEALSCLDDSEQEALLGMLDTITAHWKEME